jgi:hypothetical protein
VKGGIITPPSDAPPEAGLIRGAKLSLDGGKVTMTHWGGTVTITVQDGKLVTTGADNDDLVTWGLNQTAERVGNSALEDFNQRMQAALAAKGLKLDALTVDANGQVHITTAKL